MAPHVRHHVKSSHKVCSPAMLASQHLGFYLVAASGQRTPFCEFHTYGAIADRLWHEMYYTGPGEKSITAIKHKRTPGEITTYEKYHEVALENEISMGGRAALVHSRKRNSYDIWLFGPLRFLDVAYGSLIVELSGYESRNIYSKIDVKTHELQYWTEFPKGPAGHFNRAKLLQTGFHPQADWKGPPEMEVLKEARQNVHPAILHKPFVRVEWKVESTATALTDCALYEQEGF